MSKNVLILPILQYIIDRVREIRLELGLSQRDVSRFISPESDSNLLGAIEGVTRINAYTDHNLNIIALKFTERAKELLGDLDDISKKSFNIKDEYTIYDFYPKEPLDEVLQVKTKTDIPLDSGPGATINAILETEVFFNKPHTIKEITEYCNSFHDKNWKSNNLSSTIDYAIKKGKLKRIELPDGGVLYQKA